MLSCGDLADHKIGVGILKCSKCQKEVEKLDSSAIEFCLEAIQSGQVSDIFPVITKQMKLLDKSTEIYQVFANILLLKEEEESKTAAPRKVENNEDPFKSGYPCSRETEKNPYFKQTTDGLRTEFHAIRENSGLVSFVLQKKSPENEAFIEIHYVPGSPFFELLCKKGLILRNDADVYTIEMDNGSSFWDFLVDTKILTSKQIALVDQFLSVDKKAVPAKEQDVPLDCVEESNPCYKQILDGRRLEFHGIDKEAQLPSFVFDIGTFGKSWGGSVEIRYEPQSVFYEFLRSEGIPLRPDAQIYLDKGDKIFDIFKTLLLARVLTANQYKTVGKYLELAKQSKELFEDQSLLDNIEDNPYFKQSDNGSEINFEAIRKDSPIYSFRLFKLTSGEKCIGILYNSKSTFREDFSEYGIWVPKDENFYVAEGSQIYEFLSFLEDAEYVTEKQAEIIHKFVGEKPKSNAQQHELEERKTEGIDVDKLQRNFEIINLEDIPELEIDEDSDLARAVAMSMENVHHREK